MEMKDFNYFDSRYLSSGFRVTAKGLGHDNQGSSHHSNLIESKYEGIIFPIVFKHISGKKLTDILNTGWPSLFLISNNLEDLLKKNHFTGWETYPIILMDKKENLIEGYHGFSVTGISGPISYVNSPIIEKRYVPGGPIVKEYKGAEIRLDKWDKNDFFIPEKTKEIVITRKVFEVLTKNKITNINLTNVAEAEFPTHIFER